MSTQTYRPPTTTATNHVRRTAPAGPAVGRSPRRPSSATRPPLPGSAWAGSSCGRSSTRRSGLGHETKSAQAWIRRRQPDHGLPEEERRKSRSRLLPRASPAPPRPTGCCASSASPASASPFSTGRRWRSTAGAGALMLVHDVERRPGPRKHQLHGRRIICAIVVILLAGLDAGRFRQFRRGLGAPGDREALPIPEVEHFLDPVRAAPAARTWTVQGRPPSPTPSSRSGRARAGDPQ